MSLWKVAWRSIQQRALASLLTTISMALGVCLIVAVLVIHSVVYQSFHRGGEGYDLIVGPKGSSLDLVLASVYYFDKTIGTIPYSVYKDLDEGRPPCTGMVQRAIPICLGDNYEGHRVVGTLPEMFDELRYQGDQRYEFQGDGRNFEAKNYFEAVIGATVARRTGLKVGDSFQPTHDVAGQKQEKHRPFTVVGILKPTGTPNDRALFVNIEGFYRTAGHAEGHHDDDDESHAIPEDQKRVTAVLVCCPEAAKVRALNHRINNRSGTGVAAGWSEAQAAVPADEIRRLFDKIIGNIEVVLVLFAVMVVIVAGIGIMVSIYNSMSDRRHEIAVMRALGASRWAVMLVILLESVLLSLGGGALGLLLGHGLTALAAPVIAENTGLSVNMLGFRMTELVLVPGLILLASVVGYLPAVAAYRTDVARSLMAAP